jgi:hypothetical protein
LKSECPQIRQLLSEYIDGVLEAPEMTAITKHLQGCLHCSRERDALKAVVTGLKDIPMVKAPDNFLEKVYEKIEKHSMLDRIRDFFDLTRIGIPVEAAAFALTAVLILSILYFFPAQEKVIIKAPAKNSVELKAERENGVAQTARDSRPVEQPVEAQPPAQTPEKRIPVKLALSLMTTQTAGPIPSQSISYGSSGAEALDDDTGLSSDRVDSAQKILPIEVNSKVDEIIKSVGGTLISRDFKADTGYPRRLTAEIPAINYRRFITEIETLGILKTPATDVSGGSAQDKVFIQMDFTSD